MNNNIKIIEKNDECTFSEIKKVMMRAHNAAKNNKLSFPTSNMTEEDFNKTINDKAKWFIAIDGTKIVGTIYGVKEELKSWYYSGTVIVIKYVAILPEYSGRHIVSRLYKKIFEFARDEEIELCVMSMSEYNSHHKHVAEKNGFTFIDYYAVSGLKNYTLKYAYWINERCPHSSYKIKTMIFFGKLKARIKRKIFKK